MDAIEKILESYNDKVFYCVGDSGEGFAAIASSEDEISGCSIVISLKEINQIRDRLILTRDLAAFSEINTTT